MKKIVKYLKFILPAAAILIFVSSCKKNIATTKLVKSATITLKAAVQKTYYKSIVSLKGITIPVKGGTLALSSAHVSFGNINIQENTGNDGQYTGGSTAGGPDNESSKEMSDSGDIVLPGPFAYNMSTDTAILGKVKLYPGTFKKVDLTFMPNSNTVFQGNSIVIKGTFTPVSGSSVPFVLQSKFAGQIELNLTKTITVSANSTVSVAIVFDFSKWMGNLDFGTASQTAGTILIDATHNPKLSGNFEAALSQHGADLNEEHGTSTGTDTSDSSSD